MEHIAALMLIIGCSDALNNCIELEPKTVGYQTIEECEADVPAAMYAVSSSRPMILGQCVRVDAAVATNEWTLNWTVSDMGVVLARAKPAGSLIDAQLADASATVGR